MKGLLNGTLFYGFSDIIIQRYENYSGQKAVREAKDGHTEIREDQTSRAYRKNKG